MILNKLFICLINLLKAIQITKKEISNNSTIDLNSQTERYQDVVILSPTNNNDNFTTSTNSNDEMNEEENPEILPEVLIFDFFYDQDNNRNSYLFFEFEVKRK